MLEALGKGIDLEAGGGGRRMAVLPALGGRHLERRDALRPGFGNDRRTAESRLFRALAPAPHQDHRRADHGDKASEKGGHVSLLQSFAGTIAEARSAWN
ncbi:hypothetical protein D3C87_1735170 [compost metagenome]